MCALSLQPQADHHGVRGIILAWDGRGESFERVAAAKRRCPRQAVLDAEARIERILLAVDPVIGLRLVGDRRRRDEVAAQRVGERDAGGAGDVTGGAPHCRLIEARAGGQRHRRQRCRGPYQGGIGEHARDVLETGALVAAAAITDRRLALQRAREVEHRAGRDAAPCELRSRSDAASCLRQSVATWT